MSVLQSYKPLTTSKFLAVKLDDKNIADAAAELYGRVIVNSGGSSVELHLPTFNGVLTGLLGQYVVVIDGELDILTAEVFQKKYEVA